MARLEQILPLSGAMLDTVDANNLASDKGLVRKRVNLRPDLSGNIFANKPVPGTLLKYADLPAGANKCLGWCADNQNEAIIYFIWNEYKTFHNHCIFRYFAHTKTTEKVLYSEPALGFTANTNIRAEVIDGRLYWNDNTDQPKGFNIEKAVNYTNNRTGDKYTAEDFPLNEKVFPFVKKPPVFKPEVEYASRDEFDGLPINFNNLRKKQWQFKYCYGYEDYQESAYSEISKLVNPKGEVGISGEWTDLITNNNAIKVTVNTGDNNVKYIRVAVRDSSQKNIGAFYEFAKIEKFNGDTVLVESDTIHDVFFLNNTYLENIDTIYGNAYAHTVPLAAKDLILLDGKYIAMSMPKVGYDFKTEDLSYTIGYKETTVDFATTVVPMNTVREGWYSDISNNCGRRTNRTFRLEIHVPTEFKANSLYKAYVYIPKITGSSFTEADGYDIVEATYTTGAVATPNIIKTIRDSFVAQLVSQIDACEQIPIKIFPQSENDNILEMRFYIKEDDSVADLVWESMLGGGYNPSNKFPFANITTNLSSPTFATMKRGQYHPFGIVYNDGQGRNQIVFGDEKLYSPLYVTGNPNTIINPKITITSLPPIWAQTFRLAYIPDNSYTYFQYVPMVETILGTGIDVETNNIPTDSYFLKINQSILTQIEKYPNSLISAYTWQNGDRIRRYGESESYEILREYTRTYKENPGDETSLTETGFLVDHNFPTYLATDRIDNLEIYRPNRNPQNKIYKEIGESFAILNPRTENRLHSGNTQTQTSSLPAIIDIDFGDVYFRTRLTGNGNLPSTVVEDAHYSDYYTSSGISIGRDVIKTESKQSILERVAISENYIANTRLNRLNIFLPEGENYTVSENYGDITGIIERGDTLKIFQPHKETSIYIGKNYVKQADGTDIALNTESVFGSDVPYEAFLGCTYPRSIGVMGNNVYFFDLMTADFCRSATNGTISLTQQYGYQKYFKEKSDSFRAFSGAKDIVLGVDKDLAVVYLSFIMGSNIETIAFSENDTNKGFVFFAEFRSDSDVPELFAWYGDYMYSFVNGQLFEHGNGNPNEFYGSARKTASIEFIANQYPQLRKTFEVISVDANGDWQAEMEIEPDDNYPQGQKTRILPKMFKSHEGSKESGVPRNIVNAVGTEDLQKLYSGNKMSGRAMKVTLNSANFVTLRECKLTTINQK